MDNIAEGYERGGNKEFSNFLYIAKGSCGELRSQIIRAHDVRHIDDPTFEELYKKATILNKGIYNLIRSIKDSGLQGEKYNH